MSAAARHTSQTVATARRMAEAGWTAWAIRQHLAAQGIDVAHNTIRAWIDEDFRQRRRLAERRRSRLRNPTATGGRLTAGPRRSPEFRLTRIQSLAAVGVNASAIARVMNFDFTDAQITRNHVVAALTTGTPPRPYLDLDRKDLVA